MEAARPRTRGRRLRRGTVERPLNARLVRVGFVVVAPALLALLFSISTTGTLPRASLEPLFDGENAATIARSLSVEYPSRVPGSEGAHQAARWYRETVGALGLTTDEDVWSEKLADLGTVELRNVVTVVPGRSDETIVVVAHRDNAATGQPLGDNASGTAALVELARGFAPQEFGPDPLPQRTLVLVSTDAGSYGGAGAERFASTIAARALRDRGRRAGWPRGAGRPRLAIAGDEPVSPARALVRTAAARVEEQVGTSPSLPFVPTQLLDLGDPIRRRRAGALPRSRHRCGHPDDVRAQRSGHPGRGSGHGYRGPQARAARPGHRGAPQLSRRESRRGFPDAGQPLLRRPCGKRMDGAAHARARGRPVRPRARRPHRPGKTSTAALQAGTPGIANETRRRAARRGPGLARRPRGRAPHRSGTPIVALHGRGSTTRRSVGSYCSPARSCSGG